MLTDKIEQAMRNAVEALPEFRTASEAEWLTALGEAASLIETGADMRLEELADEEE